MAPHPPARSEGAGGSVRTIFTDQTKSQARTKLNASGSTVAPGRSVAPRSVASSRADSHQSVGSQNPSETSHMLKQSVDSCPTTKSLCDALQQALPFTEPPHAVPAKGREAKPKIVARRKHQLYKGFLEMIVKLLPDDPRSGLQLSDFGPYQARHPRLSDWLHTQLCRLQEACCRDTGYSPEQSQGGKRGRVRLAEKLPDAKCAQVKSAAQT